LGQHDTKHDEQYDAAGVDNDLYHGEKLGIVRYEYSGYANEADEKQQRCMKDFFYE